jgi:hypothetical protein
MIEAHRVVCFRKVARCRVEKGRVRSCCVIAFASSFCAAAVPTLLSSGTPLRLAFPGGTSCRIALATCTVFESLDLRLRQEGGRSANDPLEHGAWTYLEFRNFFEFLKLFLYKRRVSRVSLDV